MRDSMEAFRQWHVNFVGFQHEDQPGNSISQSIYLFVPFQFVISTSIWNLSVLHDEENGAKNEPIKRQEGLIRGRGK